MRPGEILILRGQEIDRTGDIWAYTPSTHKTEHHRSERLILIGPKAQRILDPILANRSKDEFLFSPREAVELARKKQRRRKNGSKRKRFPKKITGNTYTTSSYYRAIYKACEKAGIPAWGPNRLRHNAATRIREEFGIKVARIVLGHRSASTTLIYAEENLKKAADAMARLG